MSYDILRTNLGMTVELFGALSVAMFFMTEVAELSMYTSHVSRVDNDYLSSQSSKRPVPSGSVRACGKCDYKNKNNRHILSFVAEVTKAVGIKRSENFRSFNVNGNPLEIEENTATVVLGPNGAGKSMFFNVLSGSIPGVERGEYIKENSCFSVYCTQSPELQMQRNDGLPWTPLQILALWWPHLNHVTAESIDVENGYLEYIAPDGSKEKANFKMLKEMINKYLKKLKFLIDEDGSISSVEGLEARRKDFNLMSGGQRKKLTLAIYLTMAETIKPRVFLIDEPHNELDNEAKNAWKQIVSEIKESRDTQSSFQGTSIFITNHDEGNTIEDLKKYDKVLCLRAGVQNMGNKEEQKTSNIEFFGKVEDYLAYCQNETQEPTRNILRC